MSLVTKLNDVVENEELIELDSAKIKFKGGEDAICTITTTCGGTKFRIVNDGYFTDDTGTENYGKSIDVASGSYVKVYFKGKDDLYIEMKNRDLIYSISANSRIYDSTENLKYMRSLRTFSCTSSKNVSGDVTDFTLCSMLENVGINYSPFAGDISLFPSTLLSMSLAYTKVSGDVTSIGNYANLTSANLTGCTSVTGSVDGISNSKLSILGLEGCTNVTGSAANIKTISITNINLKGSQVTGTAAEFEAAQKTLGRTSGTCKFTDKDGNFTNITFG